MVSLAAFWHLLANGIRIITVCLQWRFKVPIAFNRLNSVLRLQGFLRILFVVLALNYQCID